MEHIPAENHQSDSRTLQSIDFAVRIVRLSACLPRTAAGRHIAAQILRSGTSPAPNYGEARGAESHADFVHKLRIVVKELNETSIWLRIIDRSRIMKTELLAEIVRENHALVQNFHGITYNCRSEMANEKCQMTNEKSSWNLLY